MEVPETRYVAVGDADVAYQVIGDGPFDLLYFNGCVSHIDLNWSYPPWAEFLARMASISRLILFDRRGAGASDRLPRQAIPTWEEWTDDVGAVLDAAGSDQAAIVAGLDSGPIGVLFAAMRPERVRALVLIDTSARFMIDEDYPIGVSPSVVEALVEMFATTWGTPEFARAYGGSTNDPQYERWLATALRAAMTPRTAAAQYRYIFESFDVRQALPLIQVPALVLHSVGNVTVPLAHGRYLADQIPGAKFVELPGQGSARAEHTGLVFEMIAEFLTGQRPSLEIDRILTTVLFTDIVGSTERAAEVGDQRWRSLLDAHDRAVREQLRRFRGREIKTTGDGFHISFDGPARAIRCARAIIDAVAELGLAVRAGLHTGECEVRGDDLAGLAVHIAARVGALAGSREVLVSSTVKDLVAGSGITFEDRGVHALKGVPDKWHLYRVS